MDESPSAILIATPGAQHADMLLMSCVLAALRPPDVPLTGPPRDVILVSGAGPDDTVARVLRAAECDTLANVFDRLAPGRFRTQVIETSWQDSPFWMIDETLPVRRIVLLGQNAAMLPPALEFAAQRQAAVAGSCADGAHVRFHFGRRDPAPPGTVPAEGLDLGPASNDAPHVGMAAVAAGTLACWLEDLDTRFDRTADQCVDLNLACPWDEPASPAQTEALPRTLDDLDLSLISAGGLMSNVALLLALACPRLRGTVSDDDSFTPDQWRYWVIRLLSELAGCKVNRTREVMRVVSPASQMLPCLERIDRENVRARLSRPDIDAVITTPDSDVCRADVADAVSRRVARHLPPRAHALAGARDFGAEVYVETADTVPAGEILMLADRAAADRAAGTTEPTSCADPRAESGVVICNLIAAGLLVIELTRVLGGGRATGCLLRYALNCNAVRAHGPFARSGRGVPAMGRHAAEVKP